MMIRMASRVYRVMFAMTPFITSMFRFSRMLLSYSPLTILGPAVTTMICASAQSG